MCVCMLSNKQLSVSFFQPLLSLAQRKVITSNCHALIHSPRAQRDASLTTHFSVSLQLLSILHPAYNRFSTSATYVKIYYYLGDPTFRRRCVNSTALIAMWSERTESSWELLTLREPRLHGLSCCLCKRETLGCTSIHLPATQEEF